MPAKILGGAAEVYFKPQTGQLVIRKIGVKRESQKVIDQNTKFSDKMTGKKGAASAPAKCKGKKYKEFKACLRREGKANWKK